MLRLLPRSWSTALLPLAFLLAPAGEQATVLIEVTSEGRPVEGAEIRAEVLGSPAAPPAAPPTTPEADTHRATATTDVQGRARLRLPAGDYDLRISRLGFRTESREVSLAAEQERTLEVELTREVLMAEGLIVTSTRSGRRVQDEPLRVEVLDREEIEEKVLMAPGHIAMLLAETGGIRVQTTSPALGSANVRIHGMRGRYTQLLADGLPLYGGQAGSLGLL